MLHHEFLTHLKIYTFLTANINQSSMILAVMYYASMLTYFTCSVDF